MTITNADGSHGWLGIYSLRQNVVRSGGSVRFNGSDRVRDLVLLSWKIILRYNSVSNL